MLEISDGVVTAERVKDGWIHVQVGRSKYVKRFNLRDTEAEQLYEKLALLLNKGGA